MIQSPLKRVGNKRKIMHQIPVDTSKKVYCEPFAENCHDRFMPDVHAGKGCTVGTTMLIDNKVCPNLVGVDIGCGVEVYKIKETELDLEKLDNMLLYLDKLWLMRL